MSRWRELLHELGVIDVVTVFQSGSAVISYDGDLTNLSLLHAEQLAKAMGKNIVVDVWDGVEVLRLKGEMPIELWSLDPSKVLVHFLPRPLSDVEQGTISTMIDRDVWFGRSALFQSCPEGVLAAPDLVAALRQATSGLTSTARNLRTFERIVTLLG
jgi:uncharacterized protein (DUF1697 family)